MKYKKISMLTFLLVAVSLISPVSSIAYSMGNGVPADMISDEISFEDMCSMPEDEFKDYCLANDLEYIPISIAKAERKYNDVINVMIRIEGYAKEGIEDVSFASDPTMLKTSNTSDYDFDRMISDLNLPATYYTVSDKYEGAFKITLEQSVDYDYENYQPKYLKLAAIPVLIRNKTDNSDLDARLYQMVEAWCSRNDNVHSFQIQHAGGASTDPETEITTTAPAISFEKGDGAVKLTWTEVKDAEKYAFYGYKNGKWQAISSGSGNSYVLKNLKAGKDYKVFVAAKVNGKWINDPSNAIIVTPKRRSVKDNPAVTFEKGRNAVKLKWDKVDGAEKYAVAGYAGGKWNIIAKGYGTSYILNDLKLGTEYRVAVAAMFNGKWNTDFSNAITLSPK